jgi:hypothetical protein
MVSVLAGVVEARKAVAVDVESSNLQYAKVAGRGMWVWAGVADKEAEGQDARGVVRLTEIVEASLGAESPKPSPQTLWTVSPGPQISDSPPSVLPKLESSAHRSPR